MKDRNRLSAGILKAMSIFGGVQVITILCSIVRTKLVALWIGAAGVGLFALYNSTIDMIGAFTRMGLRNSAIKDIASAKGSRLQVISTVVRRWSWMLGISGSLLTMILSPWLSQWTFGDDSHVTGFVILSIAILLHSITDGELAILQGTSTLGRLAKASMWGVVAGVAITVPMFYFWGIDSIVPSILTYSVMTAVMTMVYRKRGENPKPAVTFKETLSTGRGFVILGFYMMLSSFVCLLVFYVFVAYLNHCADTETVGYYQAGYTLVNKYVGLVFTAIAMEYFPRLSRVNSSDMRTGVFVSHEIMIALCVLLPVIAVFIGGSELIIRLFYTEEFLVIIPFITWAILGTVFRAVSWSMAFVMLARGDGKAFLFTESVSAVTSLTLNIVAYNLWGLNGLGYAYLGWYVVYAVVVWGVYRFRYRLKLGRGIVALTTMTSVVGVMCAISYEIWGWWLPSVIAVIVSVWSFRRLRAVITK